MSGQLDAASKPPESRLIMARRKVALAFFVRQVTLNLCSVEPKRKVTFFHPPIYGVTISPKGNLHMIEDCERLDDADSLLDDTAHQFGKGMAYLSRHRRFYG